MNAGTDHHVPQKCQPSQPVTPSSTNQSSVSRMAGPRLNKFLEPFARDRAGIPLRRGEAHFFRELAVAANQAVIAFRNFNWHNEFLAGCLWLFCQWLPDLIRRL